MVWEYFVPIAEIPLLHRDDINSRRAPFVCVWSSNNTNMLSSLWKFTRIGSILLGKRPLTVPLTPLMAKPCLDMRWYVISDGVFLMG